MATCKDNLQVREKLVEQLSWWATECDRTNYGCQASKLLVAAAKYIANGVTVQEEGYWIGEGDGYADGEIVYDVWYCENCNHCIETDDYELLPNFCPNCGMKKLPLPLPPKGE